MNEDQCDFLGAKIKGLFPKLTMEQGNDLCDRVLPKLDFRDAEDAIAAYADTHPEFCYSEFVGFARNYGGESAYERTQQMLKREREEANQVLAARERREAFYAKIVQGKTPEQIDEMASDSTADLGWGDEFRNRMLKRGPALSPVLRQCMCEWVASKGRKQPC